jgi:hypothetical protein
MPAAIALHAEFVTALMLHAQTYHHIYHQVFQGKLPSKHQQMLHIRSWTRTMTACCVPSLLIWLTGLQYSLCLGSPRKNSGLKETQVSTAVPSSWQKAQAETA